MEFNQFIAVLDTNVLAPMPLVDTLLRLAEEPAFYLPRWSMDIQLELARTLLKFGYSQVQVDRRIRFMVEHFPEAMVQGYEGLADFLDVDDKDRHVLACAIRTGAHAIVSDNLKHFPKPTMDRFGMECISAEGFLTQQYHLNPDRFIQILREQAIESDRSLENLLHRLPAELARLIHF